MKLDLLDPYHIRARLCPSIILFAPFAITAFFCFDEVFSFASSTVLMALFLAFTNYLPIIQRLTQRRKQKFVNYAAEFLTTQDSTLNPVTKQRYYDKLASLDNSFLPFSSPSDSDEFQNCCTSAISFLRERTRKNHLIQEENINYGFCKNLYMSKNAGILFSISCNILIAVYAYIRYSAFSATPLELHFSFFANLLLLLFWIFGINKQAMENSATHYAKALLSTLDSL